MLDTAVEKVIAEIERLNSEQQKEVLKHLEKKVNGKHSSIARQPDFTPRIIGKAPPPRDRSKEREWLERHRKEYSRQWVALDGNKLVSSNTDCRLVIDEARRQGIPDALIVYVEPPDEKLRDAHWRFSGLRARIDNQNSRT